MNRDMKIFGVLFYMSKFFGVLPLSRNPHDGKTHQPDSDCFSWCVWGGLATLAQLGIMLVCTYILAPALATLKDPYSDWYFYLWLQSCLSPIITLILCLCTRPKVIAKCMSEACRIYHLPTLPAKPFSLTLSFTMMVYPFVTIVYLTYYIPSIPFSLTLYFLEHNYLYIPTSAIEVMFACCCLIAERAVTDINTKMKQLQRKSYSKLTFDSIKELLESYVNVCEFVGCFSEFFSAHLLTSFVTYTVRMIIYSVSFVDLVKSQGEWGTMFTYAFLTSYLTLRLFFICYWSQKLKNKARVFVSCLRHIRIIWVENITAEQEFLLDTYEDLIESSAVEFTACGLFPINVQQILNVIGLIITYAIVAIQSK